MKYPKLEDLGWDGALAVVAIYAVVFGGLKLLHAWSTGVL